MKNVRLLGLGAVLTVWGVVAACSGGDENPATPRADSGVGGGNTDAVATGTGTTPLPGAPICGKYGNAAGVASLADKILTAVKADCRLSGAFTTLNAGDNQHLTECFEIQMQSFFQCDGVTYVAGTTKDSKGNNCRSMTDAHRNMNLRKADFIAFQQIALGELGKANLSMDDQTAINSAILGTQTGVVQTNQQPTQYQYCACPDGLYNDASCTVYIDGGTDASDSGTKLDSGSILDASDSG
jgi:hypothetical protein